MAIAEVAGGHWPETARELCVKFAPHRVGQGDGLEGPEVAIEPTALKPAASLGGRVAVAKFRILSTLQHRSPQSKVNLRLAGCKNTPGPDFTQALDELLAEGKIVSLGRASSGGKPKEMYGVGHVH